MATQLEVKYMNDLKSLVEDLEINTVKFDKKNTTAGRRARGISMKIKHMMTDLRKDVLEETKTRQVEKSGGGLTPKESELKAKETVETMNLEDVAIEETVEVEGGGNNKKKKVPKKSTTTTKKSKK